ncbi:MAG: SLC13/DASS family transporter [Deltaproteobacteria bacterium]|nr:MAG: SLC13/DASS family transporter [Deltaproteobacteria bacterium]
MKRFDFHILSLVTGIALFLFFLLFVDLSPKHPEVTRTMAVAILMALLWVTEAIPLPATALIPVVLFPFLGIMSGKKTASLYFNNVIFLFLGGFIMALAMEKWNLHRRIALKIILLIGSGYRRLLLGFMLATSFLSMWISNTATVMMMTPIAMAVISRLEEGKEQKRIRRFSIGLLLGIAYSASIGGIATLIGTPPNAIFVKIMGIYFPNIPEISFSSWFIFAMPISFTFFVFIWALLVFLYCPKEASSVDKSIFQKEYDRLGPMGYEEKVVAVLFSLLALMWLTRADIRIGSFIIHGWSSLFPDPKFIDDGTVAITVSLLLFFIPCQGKEWKTIMDWETAKGLPWGIILLFGGGFALAAGFKSSGLSLWMGKRFTQLSHMPLYLIIISICSGVSFLTEFASNTASAQVILPVMASLAKAINVSPFITMVPATISASCAFMLPVATPPNAIIFGTNRLSVWDMFKTGIFIDIMGVIIISFFSLLWFR